MCLFNNDDLQYNSEFNNYLLYFFSPKLRTAENECLRPSIYKTLEATFKIVFTSLNFVLEILHYKFAINFDLL